MAGDRGLAFVMIGLIGATIVWVGTSHAQDVKPPIKAYALARKAPVMKIVPAVRPNPPANKDQKAPDSRPLD